MMADEHFNVLVSYLAPILSNIEKSYRRGFSPDLKRNYVDKILGAVREYVSKSDWKSLEVSTNWKEIAGVLNSHFALRLVVPERIPDNIKDFQFNEGSPRTNKMESFQEFKRSIQNIFRADYDGHPDHLLSFLDKIELAKLEISNDEMSQYAFIFIRTRVTGAARYLIESAVNLDGLVTALRSHIKKESSSSLEAKMEAFKQEGQSATDFAEKMNELAVKLRESFISEGDSVLKSDEKAVRAAKRAFVRNSTERDTRTVMQASTFLTLDQVKSQFIDTSNEVSRSKESAAVYRFAGRGQWKRGGYSQSRGRGRGRGNYRRQYARCATGNEDSPHQQATDAGD